MLQMLQIRDTSITLEELTPLYWHSIIDWYVVNGRIVAVASLLSSEEQQETIICEYNRFTRDWNTICDGYVPRVVKGSFLDKARGKLYLFGLTIITCYDLATKRAILQSQCACDAVVSYDIYSKRDIQMVCKGDEVHILLIYNYAATDCIVWNFVKKERVFWMSMMGMVLSQGCRLLFTKGSDTPRIFGGSHIYELNYMTNTHKLWKKWHSARNLEKIAFQRSEKYYDPARTVVTDCGKYVINVMTEQVVILDVESKEEIRTGSIGIRGKINDQALYFHDDAQFLTAAFIRYYYSNNNNNNSNSSAGFPCYLVDYIAKWGAQEFIYICR